MSRRNSLITQGSNGIKNLCDFSHENEKKIKEKFMEIGKNIVGSNFQIRKETREILTNILKYFTGNENEYKLSKGIYLYGSYGVGKTMTMKIIQRLLAEMFPFSPNGFQITSVEQIIDVFKTDGSTDYFGYRKESKPLNICINEFGKKMNEKIYGTEADFVVNSLFMVRYELFQLGYLTHVTSNYKPEQIKVEPIIKDRMVEMFNFIEIKGTSFRE